MNQSITNVAQPRGKGPETAPPDGWGINGDLPSAHAFIHLDRTSGLLRKHL